MLICLPDLARRKKDIKNRDQSKITKYFIFPINLSKGDILLFFTNLIIRN